MSFFKNLFKKQKEDKDKKVPHVPDFSFDLDKEYLFDFTAEIGVTGGVDVFNALRNDLLGLRGVNPEADKIVETENGEFKLKITPKEALNELETVPLPFDLLALDQKIEMLETKRNMIQNVYSKRTVDSLIERFTLRKVYNEHKDFFEEFANTNDQKIDNLLKKHKHLSMAKSDLFIPEFPDEAVKIMDRYTKKVLELTSKKPIFYVIANKKDIQKSVQKRDPILLVQSPFGFYWQILGAWDEEMLLLSEL